MAKDFFGYTKDAKGPGNVVSPTMVILSIDGKKLRLAQSASVSYQRQVEPTYEIGSDSVWMVAGKSSGTCEVQRAIGNAEGGSTGGLLTPFKPGDPCKTQTLLITRGDGQCGMDPGTIYCGGCLLTNVSTSIQVGSLIVTDSANYNVGVVSLS
jgi:hypothetical protein